MRLIHEIDSRLQEQSGLAVAILKIMSEFMFSKMTQQA